jgi:type III pantothenate kinase
MNKNLVIDIGNTTISFGIGRNYPSNIFKIPTNSFKAITQWQKFFEEKLKEKKLEKILICSVVPPLNLKMSKTFKKIFPKSKIYILGKDLVVPIKNSYKNPKEVGQDRLVNAFYLKIKYGYPGICVDLGTALTFDIISENGKYIGGLIFPGVRLSIEALHKKTALLPLINLKFPKRIYGITTKESITFGIVYGFSSLIDGVIKNIKKKLNMSPIVIGTGGDIKYFKPFINEIQFWEENFTLTGLFEIMKKMTK